MEFYRKKLLQPMRPYIKDESMAGISVAVDDIPEEGGMIAFDPNNLADKWYVNKEFFAKNYELVELP